MKFKTIIYAFILLVLPLIISAQTGIINKGMHIIVEENHTVLLKGNMQVVNQNDGTFDLDGTIKTESDIFNYAGNTMFVNTNNQGTLILNGNSEQTIGGSNDIAVDNLEIKSAGVNLETNVEQAGLLTFSSGKIYLNDYNYKFKNSGTISGTFSTSNMFVINGTGEVRKEFTSAGTFTFPIGDETEIIDYSPAFINISSISSSSNSFVGVSVTDQKYYANSSSSEYLTRFWTVSGENIDNINYSATFYYVDDDIVGNENEIYATAFTDAARIPYNVVNTSNNSLSVSNQSEFARFTGSDGSIGINEKLVNQLKIFPNPASEIINIEMPGSLAENCKIDLISQQGIISRTFIKKTDFATNNLFQIQIESLSSGIYYLRFITDDQLIFKKIMIN